MQVFVTGGTGRIGSAVVAQLLGKGHAVAALARSDASALALTTAGAVPVRGDLADLNALRTGASQADGVIHIAFDGNFSWHRLGPPGTPWRTRVTRCVTSPPSSAGDFALPVEAVPQETYGLLGPIFATDQPSSSAHTQKTLGWAPAQLSLLEDLENVEP